MSAADGKLPFPPRPATLEDSGLSPDVVVELVLKSLHLGGTLSGADLADRLGVSVPVIAPVIDQLKRHQLIEIVGTGGAGAPSLKYRVTDTGRVRAALFLEHNHYVGRAPVPLQQYQSYMERFRTHVSHGVTPAQLRQAFSHLVLSDKLIDQIGPAVSMMHSLFIYGPAGNGKTVIAQAIATLLEGEIAIPYAIEVEGCVIRVFDPVSHRPVLDAPVETGLSLDRGPAWDRRWIRCRRPFVTVGGELTLESLDLSFSPTTGFYHAPVQLAANGGLLLIGDFGRERCPPHALLNRWMVPLETRQDFLTLQTGQKFEVPFVVFVVFTTNIKPAELVDEAFLRRVRYKVYAESPTREEFGRIFANYCAQVNVPFDPELVETLIDTRLLRRRIKLRGCQPRDLIDHALAAAEYAGQPRLLPLALLEAACDSYFVDDRAAPRVSA
jgi:predicted ATPase with chaperone activity